MEITHIKIYKAKKRGPVLAYANIIFGKKFIIRGITLLENEKGRFISMPSRKLIDGEREKSSYREVCHPLDNEIRKEIKDKVFEAYEQFIEDEE
jgi:stage V sporulation protein G